MAIVTVIAARTLDESAELFWANVQFTSSCWLWTGCRDYEGYGIFWADRKNYRAHRVAFLFEYGGMPTLSLCHTCDTPSCVNPEHLFVGTSGDNARDCIQKGRSKIKPGRNFTKLTDKDVRVIRSLWPAVSQNKLAAQFKVGQSTIWNVTTRRTWVDVL